MTARIRRCVLALSVWATSEADAATTTVGSLRDLQSAIQGATQGDTIVLANGSCTASSPIDVAVAGTAEAPITITAQTVGGVTIDGSTASS